jgi:hypothetical protein
MAFEERGGRFDALRQRKPNLILLNERYWTPGYWCTGERAVKKSTVLAEEDADDEEVD